MKKFIIAIFTLWFLALAFSYFSSEQKSDSKPKSVSIEKIKISNFLKENPNRAKNFHGLNLEQVIDQIGEPKSKQIIIPSDGLLEYQIELYNIIDKKDRDLEVIEAYWEDNYKGKTISMYLWFFKKNRDQIVMDSLIHNEDVMF